MTEQPEPGTVPPPTKDASQEDEASRVMADLDDDQNAAEPAGLPETDDD